MFDLLTFLHLISITLPLVFPPSQFSSLSPLQLPRLQLPSQVLVLVLLMGLSFIAFVQASTEILSYSSSILTGLSIILPRGLQSILRTVAKTSCLQVSSGTILMIKYKLFTRMSSIFSQALSFINITPLSFTFFLTPITLASFSSWT